MKYIVEEKNQGVRLDCYLAEITTNFSRAKIQKYIKTGKILLNGKVEKPSYCLKLNDVVEIEDIEINLDEKILPEDIKLDIVYEDDDMLVINKPSGMLTHPAPNETSGTLVNALLFYCGEENLSDINGEFRKGIVHRLDRNTSGLIMVAKNNSAHEFLAEQIKNRTIEKKYLAIVKGVINQDEFIIDKPIGRNPKHPEKMMIREDGKPSITKFKVLERFSDATYIEAELVTGRTHQIRVHLASISHPVLNDTLYGFGKMKIRTEEQVLQSYKLKFTKPNLNEIIELEIKPDEKINRVLKYLKGVK